MPCGQSYGVLSYWRAHEEIRRPIELEDPGGVPREGILERGPRRWDLSSEPACQTPDRILPVSSPDDLSRQRLA